MHRWIATLFMVASIPAFAEPPDRADEATYVFDDGTSYSYTRPTPFGWLGHGFGDLVPFAHEVVAPDNLVDVGLILGSTAVLVHYDQRIYDDVSAFGRRRGISQDAVGSSAKELPRNLGNWMYFIGDGRVPLAIAGTFAGIGYARDDVRMMSTASQLLEVMVSTGVSCESLKMLLGRESPEVRTKDGGAWHGPIGPLEYIRNENHYDAMPSGHLATTVAAMTVLAENYHEDSTAIYSVGGVLMTLLGFQMINNGVHWAGDYPIGAAIGYSLGKIAVRNNRRESGRAAGNWSFRIAADGDAFLLEARARF